MDRLDVAGYTRRGMHFELRLRRRLQGRGRSVAGAWPALLLAVLLLCCQAAGFAQVGDEAVREARDAVLADSRYQTERPQPQELPETDPFTIPPWLAEVLYWALLAGIAALVLFFLGNLALDLVRNRGAFKPNREPAAAPPRPVETPPMEGRRADRGTLAEADRLAAEGRFSEAIHHLLLAALARLHHELGPRIAPALTGPEVLRLPVLPPAAVEPLTRLVQLSEINHFGGRSAAEPDYRRCRDDFLRFSGAGVAA